VENNAVLNIVTKRRRRREAQRQAPRTRQTTQSRPARGAILSPTFFSPPHLGARTNCDRHRLDIPMELVLFSAQTDLIIGPS
jgi:hypothetical protein